MLNVKKLGINNILIIAITILIIACSTCVFYSTVNNTVLAETTSDSLLNFNQLVNNNYINFTNDIVEVKNISTINNNLFNHILYINIKIEPNTATAFALNSNSGNIDLKVFNSSETILLKINNNITINYFGIYVSAVGTEISNFQIIDLTQMYGAGNEPTLEECEKIFITTYNYTSGYYISNDNFNYYSQGVNSVNKSLVIGEAVSDWLNNTYNLDATEFVKNENGTIAWTKGNIATNTNYTLLANDTITITMEIGGSPESNNLIIGQLNESGNFEQLVSVDYSNWEYSAPGGMIGTYSGTLSFKLKYNTNQIIFNSIGNILVCKKIEYTTYNYDNQLLNAFKQGAESIDTNYYYQKGVSDGIKQGAAQGTAWGNSWEFISSCFNGVGDILSIEILPNLPLYTFIAIPLLLGLIVLIYKLIGSGG